MKIKENIELHTILKVLDTSLTEDNAILANIKTLGLIMEGYSEEDFGEMKHIDVKAYSDNVEEDFSKLLTVGNDNTYKLDLDINSITAYKVAEIYDMYINSDGLVNTMFYNMAAKLGSGYEELRKVSYKYYAEEIVPKLVEFTTTHIYNINDSIDNDNKKTK